MPKKIVEFISGGVIVLVCLYAWFGRGVGSVEGRDVSVSTGSAVPELPAGEALEIAVSAVRAEGRFENADCNIQLRRAAENWTVEFVFLPRISAGSLAVVVHPGRGIEMGHLP